MLVLNIENVMKNLTVKEIKEFIYAKCYKQINFTKGKSY